MRSLYAWRTKEGGLVAMMAVHVDDVLWSTTEKDDPVAALLTEFKIREMKKATEEEFRF